MGYSSWSNDAADNLYNNVRPSMPVSKVFTNHHATDKALDPKGVKLRESRDSKDHPDSNAVAIFFDVTGSMGDIPKMFAMEKLPGLMKLLVAKGYIPHPQVLFGAVGDATTDQSPLQVCQFESGLEMDDCLTKIHLEGGGGGQVHESYELGVYFVARHTATDCFEKRNKKAYFFTIGDEMPYMKIDKDQVKAVIGDDIEASIPFASMIEEISEKYEYFHIAVHSGSYPDGHHKQWKELLGERALLLDNPAGVCELIGMTIGACEDRDLDDVHKDMIDAGMDKHAADAAKRAIVPYATANAGKALRKGTVSGDLLEIDGSAGVSKRI